MFSNEAAQQRYNRYMHQCEMVARVLSNPDRDDCLMEINSYIHEFMEAHRDMEESAALEEILSRLGVPEVTLREVVADRKVAEAVTTYHPKALLQAIVINLRNGLAYFIIFILFLILLAVPVLIIQKIIDPAEVGLWVGWKTFVFGYHDGDGRDVRELLGNAFIPVVLVMGGLLYILIVQILRRLRNKHPGAGGMEARVRESGM